MSDTAERTAGEDAGSQGAPETAAADALPAFLVLLAGLAVGIFGLGRAVSWLGFDWMVGWVNTVGGLLFSVLVVGVAVLWLGGKI